MGCYMVGVQHRTDGWMVGVLHGRMDGGPPRPALSHNAKHQSCKMRYIGALCIRPNRYRTIRPEQTPKAYINIDDSVPEQIPKLVNILDIIRTWPRLGWFRGHACALDTPETHRMDPGGTQETTAAHVPHRRPRWALAPLLCGRAALAMCYW